MKLLKGLGPLVGIPAAFVAAAFLITIVGYGSRLQLTTQLHLFVWVWILAFLATAILLILLFSHRDEVQKALDRSRFVIPADRDPPYVFPGEEDTLERAFGADTLKSIKENLRATDKLMRWLVAVLVFLWFADDRYWFARREADYGMTRDEIIEILDNEESLGGLWGRLR
jgi:hypothetical protein